jgi:predicted transcriptional regulator
MNQTAKDILDRVSSWPQEDVDELAEVVREIEARRVGLYEPTADEEAAIREGLAELERGEWTSEQAMQVFWTRCGVL